jgi:hypothetical protein
LTWPLVIALILCLAGFTGHFIMWERWIWGMLEEVRFPGTMLSSPEATKSLTRIVWHYFTVDWLATIALVLMLLFTDWIEAPKQILLFSAVRWFAYAMVYAVEGRFKWRALKANTEWINVVLLSGCFLWAASSL